VAIALRQNQLTAAERALTERIGVIIDSNSKAALSMTAG